MNYMYFYAKIFVPTKKLIIIFYFIELIFIIQYIGYILRKYKLNLKFDLKLIDNK